MRKLIFGNFIDYLGVNDVLMIKMLYIDWYEK